MAIVLYPFADYVKVVGNGDHVGITGNAVRVDGVICVPRQVTSTRQGKVENAVKCESEQDGAQDRALGDT